MSIPVIRHDALQITSPKRKPGAQGGWHGFFPYYAGFPESFASSLIVSAGLPEDAVIADPWNGSGTTTYAASALGFDTAGIDLNPVMVIVARARLLGRSEADSLEPLCLEIIRRARDKLSASELRDRDPLRTWFDDPTAQTVRSLERSLRTRLVGGMTITAKGLKLENISGLAATFYVALFSLCRELAAPFRSSNPTWIRTPKASEERIAVSGEEIGMRLLGKILEMARALTGEDRSPSLFSGRAGEARLAVGDTTRSALPASSADMILTSPPYCTRIDYTAATRVELAVLDELTGSSVEVMRRQMIGSTLAPQSRINKTQAFGPTCISFLERLKRHPSKASTGYYYTTHTDYYRKMVLSMRGVTAALRPGGSAVLIVQDSYYKEIHNDLPQIITEMGEICGLKLRRREDFRMGRTMAGINPKTRAYKRDMGAIEAVLCFVKQL
ncbi:MAG: DNA methyltransferase [Pseudomonadota bacterium]